MNNGLLLIYWRRRNEEPLTLPDRLSARDLNGSKAVNGGPYIANTVPRYRSGKPVAFVVSEQEFVLVLAVPNHQQKMAAGRASGQELRGQSRRDGERRNIRQRDPYSRQFE